MAKRTEFKPLTLETKSFAFSLTDGTNIPPPPPSPPPQKKTDAPERVKGTGSAKKSTDKDAAIEDAQTPSAEDISALPQPTHPSTTHPPAPRQTSSVRRLLSFRGLRSRAQRDSVLAPNGFAPHHQASPTSSDAYRPGSPYATHSLFSSESKPSLTVRKRNSSWFSSASTRRRSAFFSSPSTANGHHPGSGDENADPHVANHSSAGLGDPKTGFRPGKRNRGPPPPSIPEFDEFGLGLGLGRAGVGGESLGASAEELFRDIK